MALTNDSSLRFSFGGRCQISFGAWNISEAATACLFPWYI